MAFLRFAVPEYDFRAFKDLSWTAPTFLSANEIDARIKDQTDVVTSAYGCAAIEADTAVFEKFDVRGEHSHAVMCVTPSVDVHLLGRSYAWWNQRVLLLDSVDPSNMNVVFDWRTPRPMNTRLGPDDGVTIPGGIYYVISSHMYDDHWVANRTITDNDWDGGEAADGFRVLGASKDDANEFCECNLSFSWSN